MEKGILRSGWVLVQSLRQYPVRLQLPVHYGFAGGEVDGHRDVRMENLPMAADLVETVGNAQGRRHRLAVLAGPGEVLNALSDSESPVGGHVKREEFGLEVLGVAKKIIQVAANCLGAGVPKRRNNVEKLDLLFIEARHRFRGGSRGDAFVLERHDFRLRAGCIGCRAETPDEKCPDHPKRDCPCLHCSPPVGVPIMHSAKAMRFYARHAENDRIGLFSPFTALRCRARGLKKSLRVDPSTEPALSDAERGSRAQRAIKMQVSDCLWILPSPARARRACPLPGQRLSIFSNLGARASKKVEHWRARLCRKQRKSTASGQGEGSEMETESK